MKPWKETSRSSKITTSSRRGLAATPSRLPVKAACIYVSFPHFDYCKDYVDVSDIWCNRLFFPFYVIIRALCDDVQLCNCCVCELLILARTWFAFGLPSKTGCDRKREKEVGGRREEETLGTVRSRTCDGDERMAMCAGSRGSGVGRPRLEVEKLFGLVTSGSSIGDRKADINSRCGWFWCADYGSNGQ
jgi:hypothetical protein